MIGLRYHIRRQLCHGAWDTAGHHGLGKVLGKETGGGVMAGRGGREGRSAGRHFCEALGGGLRAPEAGVDGCRRETHKAPHSMDA